MAKREGEFVGEQMAKCRMYFKQEEGRMKSQTEVLGKAAGLTSTPETQREVSAEASSPMVHTANSKLPSCLLGPFPVVPGKEPQECFPTSSLSKQTLCVYNAKDGMGEGSVEICLHPVRGF